MDGPTNCEPWTVRRLASHALNNQLVWAGLVTGQQLVAVEDAMGAVPIDGDLGPVAADVTARAMALWRTDGILDAMHATPFGELPGSVVIDFADHRCRRPRVGPVDQRGSPARVRSDRRSPCSPTSSRRPAPTPLGSTA